jgi:hydroxymethylbilane synthase
LHALGRGLVIENLRGNVDTRLRKLDEGQYDAIVLAAAGLRRLGWADRIRELIEPDVMCPAAGQGALAIETRDDGGAAQEIARKLNHAETNAAVTAERSLLATLEGGCQVPIGAHGRFEGPALHLLALVAAPDGALVMRDTASGIGDPAALGRQLGERMLAAGARDILGS